MNAFECISGQSESADIHRLCISYESVACDIIALTKGLKTVDVIYDIITFLVNKGSKNISNFYNFFTFVCDLAYNFFLSYVCIITFVG